MTWCLYQVVMATEISLNAHIQNSKQIIVCKEAFLMNPTHLTFISIHSYIFLLLPGLVLMAFDLFLPDLVLILLSTFFFFDSGDAQFLFHSWDSESDKRFTFQCTVCHLISFSSQNNFLAWGNVALR